MKFKYILLSVLIVGIAAGTGVFVYHNINNKKEVKEATPSTKIFASAIKESHLDGILDATYYKGYMYTASYSHGFSVYKVEKNRLTFLQNTSEYPPDVPSNVQLNSTYSPAQIRISNDFLYLGTQGDGALIYSLSNPANPPYLGRAGFTEPINNSVLTLVTGYRFDANDKIMAVGSGLGEVQFARLTDGWRSEVIGRVKYGDSKTGDNTEKIILDQDRAYLLKNDQTLVVLDLSQLDHPTELASLHIPEANESLYSDYTAPVLMKLNNRTLFMVYTTGMFRRIGPSYLVAISITDPQHPIVVGRIEIPNIPKDLITNNNRVYITYYHSPDPEDSINNNAVTRNGIISVDVTDTKAMTIRNHYILDPEDTVEKIATTDMNLFIFRDLGETKGGSYQPGPL